MYAGHLHLELGASGACLVMEVGEHEYRLPRELHVGKTFAIPTVASKLTANSLTQVIRSREGGVDGAKVDNRRLGEDMSKSLLG